MSRPRVLIVDDSPTMRQLTRLMLKKHLEGDIDEAGDGIAALEKIAATPYDAVVTDLNMPRLDGLGLVAAIRNQLKQAMPIVIVTTRGSEVDRDRGLALGADAYVTKPVDGAALARTVGDLLKKAGGG